MKKIISLVLCFVLLIGALFVLSGSVYGPQTLSKIISESESLESVEFEKVQVMEITDILTSLREENTTVVKEICGTNNTYMESEIISDGQSSGRVFIYTVQEKDDIGVYIGDGGTSWFKDTTDKKGFSKLEFGKERFDSVIEVMKKVEAESAEKEERDGKDVIVISGKIKEKAIEEMISGTMNREALEVMKNENEFLKDMDVDKVFAELAPITVEVVADADTLLPIEINMDMKETICSVYENLFNEVGYGDMEMKIYAAEAFTNIKVKGYNSIEKIELPEAAMTAEELDFLQ